MSKLIPAAAARRQRRAAHPAHDSPVEDRAPPRSMVPRATSASGSTAPSARSCPRPVPASSPPSTYIGLDKKGHNQNERVRAKHVIMACWNRVTARLVDGPPAGSGREPLLRPQGAAHLRARWHSRTGRRGPTRRSAASSPRGTSLFWDSTSVSAGAGFGPTGSPVYGPTPTSLRRPRPRSPSPWCPTAGRDPAAVRIREWARHALQHELRGSRGRALGRHPPGGRPRRAVTSTRHVTSTR